MGAKNKVVPDLDRVFLFGAKVASVTPYTILKSTPGLNVATVTGFFKYFQMLCVRWVTALGMQCKSDDKIPTIAATS
eukprot:2707931-Amphidinium_carterae.1